MFIRHSLEVHHFKTKPDRRKKFRDKIISEFQLLTKVQL